MIKNLKNPDATVDELIVVEGGRAKTIRVDIMVCPDHNALIHNRARKTTSSLLAVANANIEFVVFYLFFSYLRL